MPPSKLAKGKPCTLFWLAAELCAQALPSPGSPSKSYLRELLWWVHPKAVVGMGVLAVGCSSSLLLTQEPLSSSKRPNPVPASEEA